MPDLNDDPIIVPAGRDVDTNTDPIVAPAIFGKGKPDPRWAQAGKMVSTLIRPLVGTLSGGFVGGIQGTLETMKQAAEPVKPAREAENLIELFQAGYQGSSSGLLLRGRLPDVVLEPHHAKWYEKLTAGFGQLAGDLPAMIGGGAAAGTAAIPSGPGAIIVGGAAAFAAPAAIREALTLAYSLDQVQNSSDFLARTGMAIVHTGKEAAVGGLTAGTGSIVAKVAAPLGKVTAGVLSTGTEVGVMTIAPAALEGKLPEPEDFLNGALMIAGMKGAHITVAKLRTIYAKTGVEPAQVVADALANPELKAELQAPDAPQFKSTVEIVDSTSYQGQRQGPLLGPKDQHLVARDPATGKDIGRLRVTQTETGFEVRKVEVDPAARGKDVATQLYLEARSKFGPYEGSTDLTPDGRAFLNRLKVKHPEIFAPDAAPEVPAFYQEQARQMNALDAVPGYPNLNAEVAAEIVGPRRLVPGEPSPTHINYKYLNTTEEMNTALQRMSELAEVEIKRQTRGKVSNEQTIVEAEQRLRELIGPGENLAPREPGAPVNAAEVVSRKWLVEGAVENLALTTKAYYELPNPTPAQTAEFMTAIAKIPLARAVAEARGALAESGRTLQAAQISKGAIERGELISAMIEKMGGNPRELAELISKVDTPEGLARIAEVLGPDAPGLKVTKPATWEQKLLEVWRAGLLGIFTQGANVTGNMTWAMTRPIIDTLASIGGAAVGAKTRVHLSEPVFRVWGNLQGVVETLSAVEAAAKAIKTKEDFAKFVLFGEDSAGGKSGSRNAIPGKLGYTVRTVFRSLEKMDYLFRTAHERAELNTLAARQAASEGFNPATREFRNRVSEIANKPTEAQISEAELFGERGVFQAPLGKAGKALENFIVESHTEWIVPFRRTPIDVFKELFRLTPTAWFVPEWRADVAAGGIRAHKAWAELAFGSGIAALTMGFAFSGNVSGNGDPDFNKRRLQMAAGWQPYSVKINGTWYSYQRFQPIGTLVGMAADIAEVWEHMDSGESDKAVKMLSVAFANAVTNQAFLQGIAMFSGAMSEPERKGPRFAQNLVGSVIPSSVANIAQLIDPYQREVTNIVEAVKNRIPGLRQTLPPQRDPFGEPIASPDRFGWISPVVTKDQSTDKVRTEAARLSLLPGSMLGEGKAPKTIQLPTGGIGGKLGQVQLTPEQRDIFGDVAGHLAYNVMHGMVNSPGWDYMPDLVKEKAFRIAFEQAHKAGKAAALTDEERAKEVQRILEEVSKKLHPSEVQP